MPPAAPDDPARDATAPTGRRRSTLGKEAARERYVAMGELAALQQIKRDSEALDARAIAVGPFARLDASAVAALDGKTRGAITNLFGSQTAFQAATMALSLRASDWIERLELPRPADFARAEDWVDALFAGEAARGPRVDAEPAVEYAFLWALWLSAVPYGLWSTEVREPSMDEHVEWVARLTELFEDALRHFGVALRADTTAADLAAATANLVEGAWLNQCLTDRDPLDPARPVDAALRRAGLLLWRGATEPGPG